MRKLQAAGKYIALKQRGKIANRTGAKKASRINRAFNMFLGAMKRRYFLGLVINQPLCIWRAECVSWMSDDQQVVCCNAAHLLHANVAFCYLSSVDFIHVFCMARRQSKQIKDGKMYPLLIVGTADQLCEAKTGSRAMGGQGAGWGESSCSDCYNELPAFAFIQYIHYF